jgi:ribosomal protein S21
MKYHKKKMIQGLSVEVKDGNFEKALKQFTKRVQASGKLQEFVDRQEFLKPSVVNRRRRIMAIKRAKSEAESTTLTKKY